MRDLAVLGFLIIFTGAFVSVEPEYGAFAPAWLFASIVFVGASIMLICVVHLNREVERLKNQINCWKRQIDYWIARATRAEQGHPAETQQEKTSIMGTYAVDEDGRKDRIRRFVQIGALADQILETTSMEPEEVFAVLRRCGEKLKEE